MFPSILSQQIKETLLDYLHTTFGLRDEAYDRPLFDFLRHPEHGLFKGPFIDVRLPYRKADPGARIPLDVRPPFVPYAHQLVAFDRLHASGGHQPQHTIVTTGTGSGKTECFLYPILDHCARQAGQPGIKAILLYPMNALATDQARRLARLLHDEPALRGKVTAGLYIGGQGEHPVGSRDHLPDKRDVLREHPPDILLTNYKMLDFLLLRPEDQKLWRHNEPHTLRFIVLDELHTYDGAQGSDVACLLRRLKARLGCVPGSVCCIGTSATIGGKKDPRISSLLVEFASKIFGEAFPRDAVVGEERYEIHETLGLEMAFDTIPTEVQALALNPDDYDDPGDFLAEACRAWLGTTGLISDQVLGENLGRHLFLRHLLLALDGLPRSWEVLDAALLRLGAPGYSDLLPDTRRTVVASFLSLISAARRGTEPFLTVQVQLWVRELRRLVQKVAAHPKFAWYDELREEKGEHWLPIVHCGDCGQVGWGSVQREAEAHLQHALSTINEQWLHRHKSCRFVILSLGAEEHLCPRCLRRGDGASCACGCDALLSVQVSERLSEQTPKRFLEWCPGCGSERSLRILGSRAASLSSVAITHIFVSPYNEDHKLIAFTDSVQDASQRAAFFGNRTYRFGLRTAIQTVVSNIPDIPLSDLAEAVLVEWQKRLGPTQACVALAAPDLYDLSEYVEFLKHKGRDHASLDQVLRRRLSWEAAMEYGLNARVGRTLENTLCSVPSLSPKLLALAAQQIQADVRERQPVGPRMWEMEVLVHFLEGLLYRLRTRGGIFNPLIKSYIQGDGRSYLLSKKHQPLLSRFARGSVRPRFLTGQYSHDVFDACMSRPGSEGWHRDWACRVLGLDRREEGLNELYRMVLRRLTEHGLLVELPCGGRGDRAWAVNPDRLLLTPEVERVVCRTCGTPMTIPREKLDGFNLKICFRYRCTGRYEVEPEPLRNYYHRVYNSGRVERILTAEHTGLLGRSQRERVEEQFKTGTDPGSPNLIVCTPTLELGIDIGDLSAVMACSVPPATANYLQRVGRGGRRTGNALTLTLAVWRPHDLYFFHEPMEMLAGDVLPPGCFLDAPEMLKRQLVAHGMDCWARQETELQGIPRHTRQCLGDRAFPRRFLDYYRAHRDEVASSFCRLFQDVVQPDNLERLLAFASSDDIPALVQGAFARIQGEAQELIRLGKRLNARLEEVEARPESSEHPEVEKRDLQGTRKAVYRLQEELLAKYPLEVLTDGGVLPNYAFPEAGVHLHSVLQTPAKDPHSKAGYQAREYVRPASAALREMAPYNTFYADGRRVVITQVDVGTSARPLIEQWRLCPDCHHVEKLLGEDKADAGLCPRCQSTSWADAGQTRWMLPFKRVWSLSQLLESLAGDDNDDRDFRQYEILDVIDVGPEHWKGARLIEGLPFGYELLQGLTLREINFGYKPGRSTEIGVAGQLLKVNGFQVCASCGKVRDPRDPGKNQSKRMDHAGWCKFRDARVPEKTRTLHLYREVTSEAIRVLLPVAAVDIDEIRASFQAALQLGLRRWFQGNPGHLQVKTLREPAPGVVKAWRTYVVIYDAVPGGTGYLAEMWKAGTFMSVLQKALDALLACSCRLNPERDGCYRCLYAYQTQYDLPDISRRRAIRLLTEILEHEPELREVATLSLVALESRVESELEQRFVEALRFRSERDNTMVMGETLRDGKLCWQLTIDDKVWSVEPQVDLGPGDHVAYACRPDFLLHCVQGGEAALPVAVFCDGFEYHAQPHQETGRIADDVRKRKALIASGRFLVWSLTWDDIEAGLGGQSVVPAPFGSVDANYLKKLLEHRPGLSHEVISHGPLEQLIDYLRDPTVSAWRNLAQCVAFATFKQNRSLSVSCLQGFRDRLKTWPVRFTLDPVETEPGSLFYSWYREDPWCTLLLDISKDAILTLSLGDVQVTLRFFDETPGRSDDRFKTSWQTGLAVWNLLQFLANLDVIASEGLAQVPSEAETPPVMYTEAVDAALREALDLAHPSCHEFLRQWPGRLPEVGFDVKGPTGRVVATLELAWPDARIGIVLPGQSIEIAGWTLLQIPVSVTEVEEALVSKETPCPT